MNGKKETKAESEINKKAAAKSITLEYVTEKTLLQKLSQPSNLDLAQLFLELEMNSVLLKIVLILIC